MVPDERLPRDWYEWAARQQATGDISGRTVEELRADIIKRERTSRKRLLQRSKPKDKDWSDELRSRDWSFVWFGSLLVLLYIGLAEVFRSTVTAVVLGIAAGPLVVYVFFTFVRLMDDRRKR